MSENETLPKPSVRPAQMRGKPQMQARPRVNTRIKPVIESDPNKVQMRVTVFGHGQISTGEDFGFERRGAGEEFECGEAGGFDLFCKKWAEPLDFELATQWADRQQRETLLGDRGGARYRKAMEEGDEDYLRNHIV